ncbi:MAG: DUF1508 domain-containing protein [Neomegalonema sp.]|nr:DUF1508 domain-containing protein [Neomegalonema sp.]
MAGESDKFEVYQDRREEWRWRRIASNGKIVGAACEGYKDRKDCESNMNRGYKEKDKWEFYEDKRGEWRWRRKASNGKIVGAASEGYKKRGDAESNAARQGFKAD